MAFLKEVKLNWSKIQNKNIHPFNIKVIQNIESIDMDYNVIFLVGENGTGKSTLLEAIADKCDFGIKGGSKNSILFDGKDNLALSSIITLSWFPKVNDGFFLRAETLYDFSSYLDELNEIIPGAYSSYGGKSLHEQSHGEAFLSVLNNRFNKKAFYILDEPEAALSPLRQLSLLRIIWQLTQNNDAQFLIATHSPILMSYPNAVIYNLDDDHIKTISYEDTEHYKTTHDFLNHRDKYFHLLFKEED